MPAMYPSDLWMADGNVVLSAWQPDTDSRMLFRVHKSVLARHSTFFADLFAMPLVGVSSSASSGSINSNSSSADGEANPDAIAERNTQETYEGLPLIPLYDMAEDVQNLLLAMYNPSVGLVPLLEKFDEATPLHDRHLYTIADKYGAERFIDRIKKHIWLYKRANPAADLPEDEE